MFPVDEKTLEYLELTGRDEDHIELVREYLEAQGLFGEQEPEYTETVEFDLNEVEPSLAGHKKPHQRIPMGDLDEHFPTLLEEQGVIGAGGEPAISDGSGAAAADSTGSGPGLPLDEKVPVELEDGTEVEIGHGDVLVSAITSCTNTSNPSVMVGAGLLARNAAEEGLEVPDYVKTSLAPGSRVVTEYLERAELLDDLEELGYHVVGYGCTTCIGNSGPLPEPIENAIDEHDLWTTSVLSGNRNFEARIHPKIQANYLASPPLVVAYGLAGRMDIDLENEPIGTNDDGEEVYLEDIWPDTEEIRQTIHDSISPEMFAEKYASVYEGDERWEALDAPTGEVYDWDDESTYIREPPFFQDFPLEKPGVDNVEDARALLTLGDTVTTDHISPAGLFGEDLPAGQWLTERDVPVHEFNTYGSRRGNHEVMMRGTFANVRITNELLDGKEGGYTVHHPTDEETTVFDASERYREEDTPLIVMAGDELGTGSSRDWAAKGTDLLGIRATIGKSYERIYRDNLIGMGVLPLQFEDGEGWEELGLEGDEYFEISGLEDGLEPNAELDVTAETDDGETVEFSVTAQVDTPMAVEYVENGGVLHLVLRRLLTEELN